MNIGPSVCSPHFSPLPIGSLRSPFIYFTLYFSHSALESAPVGALPFLLPAFPLENGLLKGQNSPAIKRVPTHISQHSFP